MKNFNRLTQRLIFASLITCCNLGLTQENKPTYIVGTEYSFPPYAIIGKENKISGYDVELMQAIADKQGFNIKMKVMPWSDWQQTLNDNSIDIWVSGIAITPERETQVGFSSPYLERGTIAITQKDIDQIDKQSIDNFKIAVQSGTPDFDYVSDLIDDTNAKVVPVVSNYIGMTSILTGKADLLIGNDKVIKYYLNQHPEVEVNIIPLDALNAEVAFTVRKGRDELLDKLNQGLDKVKSDERLYKDLNNKWFGESIINDKDNSDDK